MKLLDRLLAITGKARDAAGDPVFDANHAIREMEEEDCVIAAVNGEVELGGPEDARTRWAPVVDRHRGELTRALGTVPGFRKVTDPPLGERWVVSTATDDTGELRLCLVERHCRGPVIAEYETEIKDGKVSLRPVGRR